MFRNYDNVVSQKKTSSATQIQELALKDQRQSQISLSRTYVVISR